MGRVTISSLFKEYHTLGKKRAEAYDKVYAHTDARKRKRWERVAEGYGGKQEAVRKRINALADAQGIPKGKVKKKGAQKRKKATK